jgi:hypothetical protein
MNNANTNLCPSEKLGLVKSGRYYYPKASNGKADKWHPPVHMYKIEGKARFFTSKAFIEGRSTIIWYEFTGASSMTEPHRLTDSARSLNAILAWTREAAAKEVARIAYLEEQIEVRTEEGTAWTVGMAEHFLLKASVPERRVFFRTAEQYRSELGSAAWYLSNREVGSESHAYFQREVAAWNALAVAAEAPEESAPEGDSIKHAKRIEQKLDEHFSGKRELDLQDVQQMMEDASDRANAANDLAEMRAWEAVEDKCAKVFKEVGAANAEEAIDQAEQYESLVKAINSYEDNVFDTLRSCTVAADIAFEEFHKTINKMTAEGGA